jgi:hypothetical protein
MLYLQHGFYNIIVKIKQRLYIAQGQSPPPQRKIVGAHLIFCPEIRSIIFFHIPDYAVS